VFRRAPRRLQRIFRCKIMADIVPDPLPKKPKHKFISEGTCGPWCVECRMYDRILPTAFLVGVLGFLVYFITLAPPLDFPTASYLKVVSGETSSQVAQALAQKHIIRWPALFIKGMSHFGNGNVTPGEYFFSGPQNVLTVSRRLARGDFELVPVKVTIPEGLSAEQVSAILTDKIPDFNSEAFLLLAHENQGFLFPDTYFFLPGENATTVVTVMKDNFNTQLAPFASTTASFHKPLSQIVTMASLLEREAPDLKSRRMIAGILWHRISIGMPLQVDAVFPYIIGKNTFQLTKTDLKTDSPFNTYTHTGLPPQSIVNPSLFSIEAAMTPIKSKYLFYLSDLHGNFHYSVTYAGQLANERRYLFH